jgi:3-oxoacyl-[acyl-carrier protein] reductase
MADIDAAVEVAVGEIAAENGSSGFAARCDVARVEDCDAVIQPTIDAYQRIDVLAFFAGAVQRPLEVVDFDESERGRVVDIDLKGCFFKMTPAAG